jgi:hypothetical protein
MFNLLLNSHNRGSIEDSGSGAANDPAQLRLQAFMKIVDTNKNIVDSVVQTNINLFEKHYAPLSGHGNARSAVSTPF